MNKLFGVTPYEALVNGVASPFTASGGAKSTGVTASLSYKWSEAWTTSVYGKYVHLVYVERDSVGSARRLAQDDDSTMIVRVDAGDIELLSPSCEFERADQRCADVVHTCVVAAQRTRAVEVEDSIRCEVLQCGREVSYAERCVRVTDPLYVRMLGHHVLLQSLERHLQVVPP